MKQRHTQLLKYILADGIAMAISFAVCHLSFGLGTALAVFWFFIYWLSGYYNDPLHRSRLVEFFTTLVSIICGDGCILLTSYAFPQWQTLASEGTLILIAMHFSATYAFRFCITQRFRRKLRNGAYSFKAIVIGTGKNALNLRKNIGVRIIGYIHAEKDIQPAVDNNLVLGDVEQLSRIVIKNKIDEIIIATERTDNQLVFSILKEMYPLEIEVKIIESLRILPHLGMPVNSILGYPLISLSQNRMPYWQQNVKRLSDISLSILALTITSPLILFIALCIKATSTGPVFYFQERLGRYGKKFNIIKFRSMYTDAEKETPLLSSEHDERITKTGRILRRYRLDELPQFYNVLRGDMSIVGYRPEREYFVDKISEKSPEYHLLLRILPGITSWGMVKYGYATSVEKMTERLQYDIIYAENCSILIDIKILIHTFIIIFRGREIINN